MESKELQHGVTAGMSREEKALLVAAARDLGVPYCLIMRRLVRYILDEKIEWVELFKETNDLAVNDKAKNAGKTIVRTYLSPDMYVAFAQLAEEWGSTTSVVLKRLVLLYANGKIERHAIWYCS